MNPLDVVVVVAVVAVFVAEQHESAECDDDAAAVE